MPLILLYDHDASAMRKSGLTSLDFVDRFLTKLLQIKAISLLLIININHNHVSTVTCPVHALLKNRAGKFDIGLKYKRIIKLDAKWLRILRL